MCLYIGNMPGITDYVYPELCIHACMNVNIVKHVKICSVTLSLTQSFHFDRLAAQSFWEILSFARCINKTLCMAVGVYTPMWMNV